MTDLVMKVMEAPAPRDEDPDAAPDYDFGFPEDVYIEVIEDGGRGSRGWPTMSIDICAVLGVFREPMGAASYEKCEGGFLDYTLESILDQPAREGCYVVEGPRRSTTWAMAG